MSVYAPSTSCTTTRETAVRPEGDRLAGPAADGSVGLDDAVDEPRRARQRWRRARPGGRCIRRRGRGTANRARRGIGLRGNGVRKGTPAAARSSPFLHAARARTLQFAGFASRPAMIDLDLLRTDPDRVRAAIRAKKTGDGSEVDALLAADARRRDVVTELQDAPGADERGLARDRRAVQGGPEGRGDRTARGGGADEGDRQGPRGRRARRRRRRAPPAARDPQPAARQRPAVQPRRAGRQHGRLRVGRAARRSTSTRSRTGRSRRHTASWTSSGARR